MKTAVVFVDNQVINIVLGKLLKQVKLSELTLDHNVDFFETLFSEHQVVLVDQVSPITREGFYESFGAEQQSATERMMTGDQDTAPIIERPAPRLAAPAPRTVTAQAKPPEPAAQKGYGIWLKSNAKAIIIIDDIYTDQTMKNVPGAKMSVCIHPDRAIDISTLNKEQVKKSQILRKLLGNGTLSECTFHEAQQIEDRYWAKENKKRAIEDKDLERMIIPTGVSASDYAAGIRADDEIATVDFTNEVANGREAPVETEYDDLLKTMRKNRDEPAPVPENHISLAQQIAMAEEDAAMAQQRRVMSRERVVDPDQVQARGFRRTHGGGGDDE